MVSSKRSYALAAAEEGAAALAGVTAFLAAAASSGDEGGMEAASAVLSAAGGDAASGGGEVDLFVSLKKRSPLSSLSSSSSSLGPPLAPPQQPSQQPSQPPPPPPRPLRRVPSRRTIGISQTSLGDGLGARLWAAAPVLLAALDGRRPPNEAGMGAAADDDDGGASRPPLSLPSVSPPPLQGATVLELGCGTGAGALACVALGAHRVSMTDGERRVLEVAREGVARTLLSWAKEENDKEHEQGEGSDPTSSSPPSSSSRGCCWDDPRGKLTIRRLWWGDGAKKENEGSAAFPKCERRRRRNNGGGGDGGGPESEERPPPLCPSCAAAGPPHLDDDDDEDGESRLLLNAFDVVVAADVLYDESSAPLLAVEVAARLAREPSPRWEETQLRLLPRPPSSPPPPPLRPAAFFACPVREARFLEALLKAARRRGLAVAHVRDDEALDRARQGVLGAGRARDYEGGFAFVKMEWPPPLRSPSARGMGEGESGCVV